MSRPKRSRRALRLVPLILVGLLFSALCCSARSGRGQPAAGSTAPDRSDTRQTTRLAEAPSPEPPPRPTRVIRFGWTPPGAPEAAYDLAEELDQHRIALVPAAGSEKKRPFLVGLHGQPKPGRPPRKYPFPGIVQQVVEELVAKKEIPPVVLVLPVFRFSGQNWPGFDLAAFRQMVEERLGQLGIEASKWLVFGHSGAAGCGGDGLNRAHRLQPDAVAFFDTCLGRGWQKEIVRLHKKGISTVDVRSVETAGFRPRQRPEYQSGFDFGQALGPLGLKPVECPAEHPGPGLRDQPFRCSATADGVVRGFVVDTGPGADQGAADRGKGAHREAVSQGLRYFLKTFLALGSVSKG